MLLNKVFKNDLRMIKKSIELIDEKGCVDFFHSYISTNTDNINEMEPCEKEFIANLLKNLEDLILEISKYEYNKFDKNKLVELLAINRLDGSESGNYQNDPVMFFEPGVEGLVDEEHAKFIIKYMKKTINSMLGIHEDENFKQVDNITKDTENVIEETKNVIEEAKRLKESNVYKAKFIMRKNDAVKIANDIYYYDNNLIEKISRYYDIDLTKICENGCKEEFIDVLSSLIMEKYTDFITIFKSYFDDFN